MSNPNCTNSLILAASNVKEWLEDYCEGETETIPFLKYYYVDLPEEYRVPALIIFAILFMAIFFNFLGTTADTYLAPSLEVISSRMKLSEAVAGVTLVALVNGAPDAISGIVAGGKESGGPQIAIGGLFGACFFTVSIVLCGCIKGAGSIKVDSGAFQRDVGFLIISIAYFLVLTGIGRVEPQTAGVFFVIYVFYFLCVVIQERKKSKLFKEKQIRFNKFVKGLLSRKNKKHSGGLWDSMLSSYMIKRMTIEKRKASVRPDDFKFELFEYDYDDDEEYDVKDDISHSQNTSQSKSHTSHKHFHPKASCLQKCLYYYNYPLFLVRDLTMPPFEEESWSLWKTTVTPIFGLLFMAWQLGAPLQNPIFWIIYGSIALILSLLVLIFGWKKNLVIKNGGIFALISLVGSALWINLTAELFLDFLALIQVASGLPLTYLSLTILAWGNSMDDLLVDYIISKNGHGSMAVTGVFSGQLFNVLVGFGGAMLRYTINFGTVELTLYEGGFTDILMCILLYGTLGCLILTLLVAWWSNWNLGKGVNNFVMSYYFVFFIIVSVLCFGTMMNYIHLDGFNTSAVNDGLKLPATNVNLF